MILSISHSSVFVGSESGSVRIFNWPIINNNPDFYDVYLDFSSITDLCISQSGYYLFASSINSNLFALKISYTEEGKNKPWNIKYNNNWEKSAKTRERHNLPGHSMLDSVALYKKEKVLVSINQRIVNKKLKIEQDREKKIRDKIENINKITNKFKKIQKKQIEIVLF